MCVVGVSAVPVVVIVIVALLMSRVMPVPMSALLGPVRVGPRLGLEGRIQLEDIESKCTEHVGQHGVGLELEEP